MRFRNIVCALAVVASPLIVAGCSSVKARAAFQDANKLYKLEKYKEAIALYQRAVDLDPDLAEARFYLANAHQALYRPGKPSPENTVHLETALSEYFEALARNKAKSAGMKKMRSNTLVALVQIFSEEPKRDYQKALGYAQDLVSDNQEAIESHFAMAALYEKFEKITEAEAAYRRAYELNSTSVKACSGLAGFYNKAYWNGHSRFDDAIATLEKCATLAPNDAVGYYKLATFYWDKAYRDVELTSPQKQSYAEAGLRATDKALALQPDYCDALIYKGLLLRVKAQIATTNFRLRDKLLDEAEAVRKLAVDCKKTAAETAAATGTPTP
jgi:tetratricopeptide (TPR) repeat protein